MADVMIKRIFDWLFPADRTSLYDGSRWSAYEKGPSFSEGMGRIAGIVLVLVVIAVLLVVL